MEFEITTEVTSNEEEKQIYKTEYSNSILNTLSDNEKELYQSYSNSVFYQKGETIIKQNSFATFVAVISSGLIKLKIECSPHKSFILNILKPGDLIGLSVMYGIDYYDFTAQALTDVVISQIKINELKSIANENNLFFKALLNWHCLNANNEHKKFISLATKQLPGKLAEILLDLSSSKYIEEDIFSHITRKDLAELMCSNTETIIRILSDFKRDGYISFRGKKIEIKNPKLLMSLAKLG